ncbi:class I adenylate-forming enzyme family protein [Duganella sp. Root336D2]|uniref:class I adenylate-forming enzyme family protein n=1 Tax=Duganella sp. Root336D2 TaxID=1736518 RepID=UPI0006F4AC2E|nr:AMP-binding protein [Duganella sp. Root336D2]KQV51015.1 AMP-dependent synthetase [Duganella sp. Root336D2]
MTERMQETLGNVVSRSARRNGAAPALLEHGRRMPYAQLDEDSNRFAHYLLASGLQPGDKVAMLSPNSMDFVVASFGIMKAGLVWVPVNAMLSPTEVAYIVQHAEARLLVVDAQLGAHPAWRAALPALGVPLLRCGPGAQGAGTLTEALIGQPATPPALEIDEHALAMIMYTSGTTGHPKGAMHSHRSVLSAVMSNAVTVSIVPNDVLSAILPLFHCAQFSMAAAGLACGAAISLSRSFDPAAVLATLARERVTLVAALPAMYGAMLLHPARAEHDLSALRLAIYAMAPMAPELLRRLMQEFCPRFALGSGQTEMFPMTVYFPPEQQHRTGNCWGQATPVNDTAIMDADGRLLGKGEVGEIVHRGANAMLGYFKDPEATAAVRRFGWHHTGDLGMWDEDGYLHFKGRLKDMIKTGGENVPAIRVEEALLGHPAVAVAAVVGLPHEEWIEAVTAFVCLKPGQSADAGALQEHCRSTLAGFEIPKHIAIVENLPMTSTGKIQKHVLRANHQALYG